MRSYHNLLGSRIRVLRAFHKMTAKELSNSVGLSQSFLSSVENGDKSLSIENLSKIARILKVTETELLRGVEVKV